MVGQCPVIRARNWARKLDICFDLEDKFKGAPFEFDYEMPEMACKDEVEAY